VSGDKADELQPAAQRSPGVGRGFPRAARLRKHADFDLVYKEGRRVFSENMTVFVRRRGVEAEPDQEGLRASIPALTRWGPRVGFTVSRAMGGAVQRNRIKRRLREAVRLHLSECGAPVDVVINPKRTAIGAEFAQLSAEVQRAFAGIQQREGKQAGTRPMRGRRGQQA